MVDCLLFALLIKRTILFHSEILSLVLLTAVTLRICTSYIHYDFGR